MKPHVTMAVFVIGALLIGGAFAIVIVSTLTGNGA